MKLPADLSGVVRMGIDISKNVFQLHGVNKRDKVVLRRKVSRNHFLYVMANVPPCIIGMEACGSAHYWARELEKFGHTVHLMAGHLVKPYVQNNKNDARDADAICEAVGRSRMRFVPIKSIEQQDIQGLHRVRQSIMKSRTAQGNQIRGLLAEYGIAIPKGVSHIRSKLPAILENKDNRLSEVAMEMISELYENFCNLELRLAKADAKLKLIAERHPRCRLLLEMGGIGYLSATALYAGIGNGSQFRCGRDAAAWLGLVPRQYSTGGKTVLLGITKRGSRPLRALVVHGARSVVQHAGRHTDQQSLWIQSLKARGGTNKAAVALANKMVRVAWAILRTGEPYKKAA